MEELTIQELQEIEEQFLNNAIEDNQNEVIENED